MRIETINALVDKPQAVRTADDLPQRVLDLRVVVRREDPDDACHGPGLAVAGVGTADAVGGGVLVG